MPPRYVAAFRTYTWDDDVAELARRFFSACPNGRQVVLADETRGPLGIPDYEVVSHTEDSTGLGVPIHPRGNSLWYNVDYGAYFLRRALPGYSHYLLSEADLAVNVALEPMVAAAARRGIDIVTHDVRRSEPRWAWHAQASANFAKPWRALLFFMLFSARAIDHLLAERQRMGAAFAEGRMLAWPFCEPFVPSVLKAAGMHFAEIGEFADTADLRFRPRLALADPRANRPGSLAHSVLGRESFKRAVIREAPQPSTWFDPASALRIALDDYPLAEIALPLRRAMTERREHAAATRLTRLMAQAGIAEVAPEDLACCKPACTSSISPWSLGADPMADAAGANGPGTPPSFGFHTAQEDRPWWRVDLIEPCVVEEVRIVNRHKAAHRFVRFAIETSDDGATWTERHRKDGDAAISSDAAAPHCVHLAPPVMARFVRVRLDGRGPLHLRQVQVMGRRADP